jgi:hypothetical protein
MRMSIRNSNPWTSKETRSYSQMFQHPQKHLNRKWRQNINTKSKTWIRWYIKLLYVSRWSSHPKKKTSQKTTPLQIAGHRYQDSNFDCLKLSSQNLQLGSVEEAQVYVLNCQHSRGQFQSIPSTCFISFSDMLSILFLVAPSSLYKFVLQYMAFEHRPTNWIFPCEVNSNFQLFTAQKHSWSHTGLCWIRMVIPSCMDRPMHEGILDLLLYSPISKVCEKSIYFNYTKSFKMVKWFHWGSKD